MRLEDTHNQYRIRELPPAHRRSTIMRAGLALLGFAMLAIVGVPLAGSAAPLGPGVTPTPAPATPISTVPAGAQVAPRSFPPLQYGFDMALLGNNSAVRSMGFGWVQYGVYWKDAEPSPGSYDWGNTDNIVNAARDAGVNVLIRVSRPPQWARDPGCAGNDTCPPSNPADFGNFAGALAAHVRSIRGLIRAAYEIWNEPNTDIEWGGMCPDPARYTALLAAAYPNIKGADPAATVAGGAVTTVGEQLLARPGCHMDDILFIQGMYQAGASPYFDVLSDHPYGFASAPEADPNGATRLVFRRAESHRQLMIQYGDAGKQIWATEMGWALDPATVGESCTQPDWYYIFNPQQQANYLVRAFQWARSYWPWMGNMFVWNFDFSQAPWYGQCDAFRFWSVIGRPAQSALASFVQNPPPTYTPVPATPTPTFTPTTPPDNPPSITDVRYSNLNFSRFGGTLTIEMDANDPDSSAIDTVQATVQFPDGSTQLFQFDLVAGTNQLGTWRSPAIPIGPNDSAGPVYYTVTPYATEQFPPRRNTFATPQQILVANTRFWDVPTDFWAYTYIENLANAGVISGYGDFSFRPGNLATRAQLSKIVVLAFNFPVLNPPTAHFEDVPQGSTFYEYVETAFAHALVGGYACGGPAEPCVPPDNRPYFRPNTNITRAQIAKIVVLAAGWQLVSPRTATFEDVPTTSVYYQQIETAFVHGLLGGYACGGPAEPCVPPGNRPYFRPNANTTRAQICKLVYLAISEATPTPTATSTATSTATGTSTATATSTRTGIPSSTSTSVATVTGTPSVTSTSTVPAKTAPPPDR